MEIEKRTAPSFSLYLFIYLSIYPSIHLSLFLLPLCPWHGGGLQDARTDPTPNTRQNAARAPDQGGKERKRKTGRNKRREGGKCTQRISHNTEKSGKRKKKEEDRETLRRATEEEGGKRRRRRRRRRRREKKKIGWQTHLVPIHGIGVSFTLRR